jgi:nicotinamidase-related amidase
MTLENGAGSGREAAVSRPAANNADNLLAEYAAIYGIGVCDLSEAERAVVLSAADDYESDRHGAFEIRPERTAVIVIDMQEDFVRPSSPMWVPQAERMIPALRHLLRTARAHGSPVLFTAANYLPRHPNDTSLYCAPIARGQLRQGSAGVEIAAGLVQPGDYVLRTKHTYDAFFGTELDPRLRAADASTVIITGTLTNYCCEATARAAFDRGYHVVFASDLTATDSPSGHVATLRTMRRGYARVMRGDDIERALSSGDELHRNACP